ncbi:DNA-binding transcription factor [Lecanora helva]
MEGQEHRGRSSSAGHQANQTIRSSPSPHAFHNQSSPPSVPTVSTDFNPQSLSPNLTAGGQFNLSSSPYLNGSAHQSQYQPQQVLPSNDFEDQNYQQHHQQNRLEPVFQREPSQLNLQQPNQHFPSDALGIDPSFEAFSPQPDFLGKQAESFGGNFMLDPQLDTNIQPQNHINPADIMSTMSSPQNVAPTLPHQLMPPEALSSGPASPISRQGQQFSPRHSRQASLDPSTAFTNGQQPSDWVGDQFRLHRRAPSEHSDVSSSVAPSPFLVQQDSFDTFDHTPSPMLNAQQDPQMFENGGLGIEAFSLSEPQDQRHSPGHSPFVSPRMSPQPGLGIAQDANFMPLPNNSFNGGPGSEIYTTQPEQFPAFPAEDRVGSNDMGQATQMAPPEINVEFAPTTRQPSFEPPRMENEFDGLSPPERGRRGRIRAKSDTYISRPNTPNSAASTLGSSESIMDQRRRSLSPYDPSVSPSVSRESSPGLRTSPSRRSSTSSIPNRDYILDLADPTRPPAADKPGRVQKHPATFQCTLCPKKFTRAYNLRSHLRTHTDERPFVCTVCGKAFARQHDRKRHEGLHSGEKKFVCKGDLGTGGSWGCGRRFARADALGRHFRSEAGRVCIKPLLDEEAMERQRAYEQQVLDQNMQNGGMAPPPPMNGNVQNYFPAALLQQYPALQGIQWDLPGGGDESEISARSSYDASSGGEYFDEPDEGGYVSGPGTAYATGNGWEGDMNSRDWASDYEGR